MMEKRNSLWKKFLMLNWPYRIVILLQGFLILLFLILYLTLGRQQMIKYDGAKLLCRTRGAVTTYSGTLRGQKAVFTVSPGPVVEYRLGDTLYGPYTILEDPAAAPDLDTLPRHISSPDALTGVEIRDDSRVLFRGAVSCRSRFEVLSEDGSAVSPEREMAQLEPGDLVYGYVRVWPDIEMILRVAFQPDPVQRGHWALFWLGVLLCAAIAISVLFVDDLFRWNLRFVIRDPDDAEPSEWALFSRWLGWIVLTIMALVIFIMGLNAPGL